MAQRKRKVVAGSAQKITAKQKTKQRPETPTFAAFFCCHRHHKTQKMPQNLSIVVQNLRQIVFYLAKTKLLSAGERTNAKL